LTKQTVLSLRKNVCWHALKTARYVELFFSRVCTESNFGLFTFDCLRHWSTAYRVLHTSRTGYSLTNDIFVHAVFCRSLENNYYSPTNDKIQHARRCQIFNRQDTHNQ